MGDVQCNDLGAVASEVDLKLGERPPNDGLIHKDDNFEVVGDKNVIAHLNHYVEVELRLSDRKISWLSVKLTRIQNLTKL